VPTNAEVLKKAFASDRLVCNAAALPLSVGDRGDHAARYAGSALLSTLSDRDSDPWQHPGKEHMVQCV
jgi:hypothetical protein